MSAPVEQYVIHDGYYGFITGDDNNGRFTYSVNLGEAKHFTYEEVLSMEDDLCMDHPAALIDICELGEAQSMTFKLEQ